MRLRVLGYGSSGYCSYINGFYVIRDEFYRRCFSGVFKGDSNGGIGRVLRDCDCFTDFDFASLGDCALFRGIQQCAVRQLCSESL